MVRHHLVKANCNIIMLQETKCGATEGEKFIKYCKNWTGYFHVGEGESRGLGIMWNPNTINLAIISEGQYWISANVQSKLSPIYFLLWNIYGPIQSPEKRKLWDILGEHIKPNMTNNYIIRGDFNSIVDLLEKKGGINKINKDMIGFRDFIQVIEAVDCIPSEGWFTWTNRRLGFTNIAERLDRFLTGTKWFMEGTPIIVKTFSFHVSDHYPIMLEIGLDTHWGGSYFKF
ncbi:uncharacterized protein LOC131856809 [Cryptomeria japonica]|uniref:uncharacterized protein LOC131856809 n=1 Tax=Cryptomeria japonica TaxID=3369 RepID=UPI0027D9E7E1|nr:uncharacterized protein LOC131856809 [Cryptomeria japonica]